jgi:hypothetical protein
VPLFALFEFVAIQLRNASQANNAKGGTTLARQTHRLAVKP